jgi:hypothetical protein
MVAAVGDSVGEWVVGSTINIILTNTRDRISIQYLVFELK